MAHYSIFPIRDAYFQIKNGRKANLKYDDGLKYSSIYCLKALGAFFVVCIHCFGPWIIFPIIRTAVPFFFIISGFFIYREDPQRALIKCVEAFKKVFWITLYANLFYYIACYLPTDLLPIKSLKSLVEFITVGRNLGFHLWYLNAYLETLGIVILALKFRKLRQLWYLIPIGIAIGLATGKYEFLFPYLPNNIVISRNFFTIGIPCFGMGWLIRQYSRQLLKFFTSPLLLTLLILILSECEMAILKFTVPYLRGDYLITTFPLAASIVLSAVKYPLIGRGSMIELIGKEYSTYIYIFHVFVFQVFLSLNSNLLGLPSFTFPFIVFILTVLFIIIWRKGSKTLL